MNVDTYLRQRRRRQAVPWGWLLGLGGLAGLLLLILIGVVLEDMAPSKPHAPASEPGLNSTPVERRGPTMSDFRRLRNGMTYLHAWDVLGGPGELTSENTLPDGLGGELKTELYTWSGLGWSVVLTFQNDALMSKSQFGLE